MSTSVLANVKSLPTEYSYAMKVKMHFEREFRTTDTPKISPQWNEMQKIGLLTADATVIVMSRAPIYHEQKTTTSYTEDHFAFYANKYQDDPISILNFNDRKNLADLIVTADCDLPDYEDTRGNEIFEEKYHYHERSCISEFARSRSNNSAYGCEQFGTWTWDGTSWDWEADHFTIGGVTYNWNDYFTESYIHAFVDGNYIPSQRRDAYPTYVGSNAYYEDMWYGKLNGYETTNPNMRTMKLKSFNSHGEGNDPYYDDWDFRSITGYTEVKPGSGSTFVMKYRRTYSCEVSNINNPTFASASEWLAYCKEHDV